MEPLKLILENFCGHSYTEIDFTKFSSALILGAVKDNLKLSNGAGKSTIFLAIEYVLFNETRFSSLDKFIRDGADICRVSFEFKVKDGNVYRVVRSRGKKAGADLRLYKNNVNDIWDDITQRRNPDSEKELLKLLKINYKTFLSTVLFSQSKSETAAQLEYSDIAAISIEKRKSILKEILQLNSYSKYEKHTKQIISDLIKEIDKNKTILETIGNPDNDIEKINYQIDKNDKEISKISEMILNKNQENNLLAKQFADKNIDLSVKKNTLVDFVSKRKDLISSIESVSASLDSNRKKYSLISKELNNNKEKIDSCLKQLSLLKAEDLSKDKILLELQELEKSKIELQINTRNSTLELELLKDIPDVSYCDLCKQEVSAEHINKHKENNKIKRSKLENVINNNKSEILLIDNKIFLSKKKINSIVEIENEIIQLEKNIHKLNADNDAKKNILSQIELIAKEEKNNLSVKQKQLESFVLDENLNKEIVNLEKEIHYLNDKLKKSSLELDEKISIHKKYEIDNSILNHKLTERKNDKKRSGKLLESISKDSNNLEMYYKVSSAFGSSGIPALVIHTVLDDLQVETNDLLGKLRPGLQVQFSIQKNKNGDLDETLDIIYLIEGISREFRQLSGAQKLLVSLCLKLGMLAIIRKRLDIDIKLLLLDEVDQALDEAGVEMFANTIKTLQEDYKILIISHNNSLKDKFTHTLIVNQNDDLTSTTKLVEKW
jgi:DNA repair exonuclease SbcCD ATPase subunit